MAKPKSRTQLYKGILTLLFGAVFATMVFLEVDPFGGNNHAVAQEQTAHDTVNLTLQLADGPVEIELWRDVAPLHVERIATLAAEGFYNGIVFHRVIENFMAQTGDPTGTGMGGSTLPDLKAEFSDESFVRGTLGMARSQSPNSANSQFFITFGATPHLNGQYTVFGQVVAGMDRVDAIKKGAGSGGVVTDPDAIVSLTVND